MISNILMGCTLGFVTWLALLESPLMGNIIFRTDSEGKKRFTFVNIKEYLKGPFTTRLFWNPDFLPHNWIFMTALGGCMGHCM